MHLTGERITNWAGNVIFGAQRLHRPSSVAELQALVSTSHKIRPLGTGHSFSRIADTADDLVSVAGLPPTIDLDTAARTVRVAAGLRYGEVVGTLDGAGLALQNLGSLPHISIAGACATGTHGSGDSNGILATAVRAMEIVTADGDVVEVHRDDGDFNAMVVGLGAFGVVTALTLELVPARAMEQHVYLDLPWEQVAAHFDTIMATGHSVSIFTDWRAPHAKQVWLRRRTDQGDGWTPEPQWLGASRAERAQHPVPGMPAENCTQQLGVPGPWHERLPAFRLAFTPSSGEEIQSEYLLPREHATAAVDALRAVGEALGPALQVAEIRTIAADELWLSPAYQRDSVAFHFTWVSDPGLVRPAVAAVENALLPYDPRPHWGKVFGLSSYQVHQAYERLDDFGRLTTVADPAGKFRNAFLDGYLADGRG